MEYPNPCYDAALIRSDLSTENKGDAVAIIALARGTFSGAKDLAQQVAETLNYRLVSREDIIEKTAQYGVTRERLDRARQRKLGLLQRKQLDWIHYRAYARAALTKEIRRGSLVYLGSNGRVLLRDFPNVLNVMVAADIEYRIDNLIRRTEHVMNRRKARRLIEEIDERKAKWQRHFHRENWNEFSEFDLVIQASEMSIPAACEQILTTLEQPEYQTTHKSLETIDLLTVAAELRARIAMIADVVDDNVQVEARDGVIVVTGSVRSTEDMDGIRELFD